MNEEIIIEQHVMSDSAIDKDFQFKKVYQSLDVSAKLKSCDEDFIVEENITIDFSEQGEHCWLYIKKSGLNTDWVAQQLARYCGVKKLAVSYAGLKDRHAVTSQWFSIQLPGKPTPDWQDFEAQINDNDSSETIQVLKSIRHNKKLQRGALKSNRFEITLRELSDDSEQMYLALRHRCELIAEQGVANYFGRQRFGRNFNNLDQAAKHFLNPRFKVARHKRSLYLSAARSWIFNHILSQRIDRGIWDRYLRGDVFMLDGRSACFVDDLDEDGGELEHRLAKKEIHPAAVLWGDGDTMAIAEAAVLESAVVDTFPVFRDGLVAARVQSQRRACRVIPGEFNCRRQGDSLQLSFVLPPGCYATTVLGEIFSRLDEVR